MRADGDDPSRPLDGPRVLHLFANSKWTGPADPAIRAARGLRRLGADVLFAQATSAQGGEHRVAEELRRERLPVTADLMLPKHYRPHAAWRDGRVLAARLQRGDFDVLHAHLLSDQITAALAKRLARRPIVLVRSLYEPGAPPRNLRARFAFGATDGVVVPTRGCGEQIEARFGFPPERILVQEPTTDAARFDRLEGDLRAAWGVAEDAFLIGITARVQPHRRFGFLWEVARAVVDQVPAVRFVLLGRGAADDLHTHVHLPLTRLGLRDHVILPGYLREPEYSLALKSFDLFVFLVPGSDGTCRAVREALAAGVPVVTTKRGILPELVSRRHGTGADAPCGLAIEEDVGLMAGAILRLIHNPEARSRLRAGARARVTKLMDEAAAARRLLGFYRRLRAGQ